MRAAQDVRVAVEEQLVWQNGQTGQALHSFKQLQLLFLGEGEEGSAEDEVQIRQLSERVGRVVSQFQCSTNSEL